MQKRLFCFLLFLPILLSDCTSGSRGQSAQELKEQITITVNFPFGDALTAALKRSVFEDYVLLNPHIIIMEQMSSDLRFLDAVGEFPDLLAYRHSPVYFEVGKIGEIPADIAELFEDTHNIDGKTFAVPMTKGYPTGIIYSKKIFRQLGIDAENILTYNDFLAVCEKIKNAGIAPIVIGCADIWHLGFWWGYFWQREVSLKNPDWLANRYDGKVKFTDPEVRAAMNGLYELFHRGFVINNWYSIAETQCPGILVSGQAAMYYIGPFVFQQIIEINSEFEFGFFVLPDNEKRINIISGPKDSGWAISKEAQNDPAKAEVIYDFIRYFFSRDVYASYLGKTNAISSLKEKFDYPVSEQFRDVIRAVETADNEQPNWNQMPEPNSLPHEFRNYSYRLVMQWFMDMYDIDEVLYLMDREWNRLTE